MNWCTVTNQVLEQIIPQIRDSLKLTDMILNGAWNGKHAGMILINLQKAFDTLNHTLSHKWKIFFKWLQQDSNPKPLSS